MWLTCNSISRGGWVNNVRPRVAAGPLRDLYTHRHLLRTLIRRDITSRYKGSAFGALWSIVSPLILFCGYWFFLGVVLGARWGTASSTEYPVILFSGLIVHQCFAEVLGRSTRLVISHSNYVSKVVFPIEVLPWMTVATAAFDLTINCFILLLGQLLIVGHIPVTWLWMPLVLLPLLPMAAGFSWLVSSLGVYLRDMAQVVPLVIMMLMFLSPIFYSIDMVPEQFRTALWFSPLTTVIQLVRQVAIEGRHPDATLFFVYTVASFAMMAFGYWWFQRTKRGFADVL